MKAINLIPAYHLLARRRRARIRVWASICGVYGLLILGTIGAFHVVYGKSGRVVAGELARVVRELDQDSKTMASLQPELAELQLQLEASRAVAVQPDWSVLMALMGRLKGEATVLSRATLTPIQPLNEPKPVVKTGAKSGGPTVATVLSKKPEPAARKSLNFKIELTGLGRSQSDVSQYVLRLEETGLFQRVKLVETTLGKFNDAQVVSFRVECLMSEDTAKGVRK